MSLSDQILAHAPVPSLSLMLIVFVVLCLSSHVVQTFVLVAELCMQHEYMLRIYFVGFSSCSLFYAQLNTTFLIMLASSVMIGCMDAPACPLFAQVHCSYQSSQHNLSAEDGSQIWFKI